MDDLHTFKMITDGATHGVMIADRSGQLLYANEALAKMHGFSAPELLGQPLSMLQGEPEQGPSLNLLSSSGRDTATEEVIHRRKDGSLFPALFNALIIRGAGGEPSFFSATITDLTAARQAAEEQLRHDKQLQLSQKMEAIGTLAGGLAHDFKNILQVIQGNAELALLDTPEGGEVASCLDEVLISGRRAMALVRRIQTFSRHFDPGVEPVQLQPILKETVKLLRSTLPATIDIRPRIDPGCGLIQAEASLIHQAVMNICTNAGHAMSERGGVLELALAEAVVDDAAAAIPDLNPGKHVVLTITDTGDGMDKVTLDRIFEPYFTTRPAGEGSGMGLATAYGIVRSHHGVIAVDSEVGRGSTFTLFFPLYTPPAADLPEEGEEESKEAAGAPGQQILLVDAEPPIGKLTARSLQRHGYRVNTFSDGHEALARFRAAPEDVDLMITDLTMTHLTGADLIKEIKQLRGDIPIILCAEYSDNIDEQLAQDLGATTFINKPIPTSELIKSISALLSRDAVKLEN